MTPTRILITGSRDWTAHSIAEQVIARLLAKYGPNIVIVHGAADGVDSAFHLAAREQDIAVEAHPARWDDLNAPGAVVRRRRDGTPYAANAGPLRNAAMVSLGADICIAVHRDLWGSKGTSGCVRLALAAGIPVWLIDSDDCVPRKITRDGAKGQ